MPATSKLKRYNPRRPERTLLCQTVAAHYETWPETKPPRINPARGLPHWNDGGAQDSQALEPAPDWDESAQTAPDFEVYQRLSW
jgi:hypothetical protein